MKPTVSIGGVIILLGLLTSAQAEDRKVDFTQAIIIDGKPVINDIACPIKDGKRPCEDVATFGEFIYFVLEMPTRDQSWTDAIKRDDLARRIRTAKDWSITGDQIAMIQRAAGPVLAPSVLGVISKFLGS